jgi:DNA repair exonuclease SbcCD ATPase subunit
LQERRRTLEAESAQVGQRLGALEREQAEAESRRARTESESDPRAALESALGPVGAAAAALRSALAALRSAEERLAEEGARRQALQASGDAASVAAGIAQVQKERARQQAQLEQLQAELRAVDLRRSALDERRGDLAGRIERRAALPTGAGAACEACGAPIDEAHNASEIAAWREELSGVLAQVGLVQAERAEGSARAEGLRGQLQAGQVAEERLRRAAEALVAADALVTTRMADRATAELRYSAAGSHLSVAVTTASGALHGLGLEVQLSGAQEPEPWLGALEGEMAALRLRVAEDAGRRAAERVALVALCLRLEGELRTVAARLGELEREIAALVAQISVLERKAARAERFRRVGAGFKAHQLKVRTEVSQQLAADTLELHRRLTGAAPDSADRGEFTALTIDPARYSVEVVPRDLGEPVPAALYEGGGQRLLLGLAFRLALVRQVGGLPFVLLDEPTYGLDVANRERLLERIAGLGVADQFLLITHQAMGEVSGRRIRLARQGKESVVESVFDSGAAAGGAA